MYIWRKRNKTKRIREKFSLARDETLKSRLVGYLEDAANGGKPTGTQNSHESSIQ